jgi:hypothetical protein
MEGQRLCLVYLRPYSLVDADICMIVTERALSATEIHRELTCRKHDNRRKQ